MAFTLFQKNRPKENTGSSMQKEPLLEPPRFSPEISDSINSDIPTPPAPQMINSFDAGKNPFANQIPRQENKQFREFAPPTERGFIPQQENPFFERKNQFPQNFDPESPKQQNGGREIKSFVQKENLPEEDFAPGLVTQEFRREIDTSRPIFIKVERYRGILKEINVIKDMISSAGNSLNTMHSIKHSEDAELAEWRSTLEDIERKIVYMDEALFGER